MLRELQGTGQLGLRGKGKELMDSVAEDVQAFGIGEGWNLSH